LKKKLLVMCPSRGRANKIGKMIKSFEDTADREHTELNILLDDNDSDLEKYKNNVPSWVKLSVYEKGVNTSSFSKVVNRCFEENKDYEFYCVTADDIIFLTKGWDKRFCNKNKFTTGIDDNIAKKYEGKEFSIPNVIVKGFPTICGMDGDIVRALGWIALPCLIHGAIDFVWYWVAKRLHALQIEEDIHWVQNSAFYGNEEVDETFKVSNSFETKTRDCDAFTYWLKYECNDDLYRVKKNCEEVYKNYIKTEECLLNAELTKAKGAS